MTPERPSAAAIAATYARIAGGSAAGGLVRWLLPAALPGATELLSLLIINASGSFLIGALAGLAARRRLGERAREALMTGFCGGYTTFSAFSLATLDAWHDGRAASAAAYVGVSLIAWLMAVWAGHTMTAQLKPGSSPG
jgi:CrcB protein